jgi:SAM-dependent MidA family methyltransferase
MTDAPDAAARAHSERLMVLIREAIAEAGGALPFDRFMELALYAPGLGYYVAGAAKLGPGGDFVTAPEISPLFGRCVAEQCREALARLEGGDILELGAGTGALAAQVLEELDRRAALPGRYLILEPSPELTDRQRRLLAERVPAVLDRVFWLDRLPEDLRGVVLANEVLDALPVHRFRIGASGDVEELFVIPDKDGLAIRSGRPASPGLSRAIAQLQSSRPGLRLAPGYCSEINLRLAPWMRALASGLAAGMLLLIDYGYPRAELYLPERHDGTLLCHYRHRAHQEPLVNIGLQDITAHVDFSAVAEAGVEAGLELAGYTSQANFLLGCGLDRLLAEAGADPASLFRLTAGAKQLILPSAMGERFQAMALTKRLPPPEPHGWCGFALRDLRGRL